MYKIIFEDNTIFQGGNPENSLWNKIPNKPIKKIVYKYKGKTITLEGYSSYCHIVKRGSALIGNFSGILEVMLMARTKKESQIYIWDLKNFMFYTATTKIDKEYNGNKVSGWKLGLSILKPTFEII